MTFFIRIKDCRAGKYEPRLGAPFGALFCKVKIPFGDVSVIYILIFSRPKEKIK